MSRAECPSCGHRVKFQEEHAGKKARCRQCDTSFRLPVDGAGDGATESEAHAFDCPECGADLEMKRSSIGKTTTCPACAQRIVVPAHGARPRPDEDDSPSARPADRLTVGDWLVCIFLPCVGIIAGFVRLVMGRASGAAMLGYSVLFSILWVILKVGLALLASN